jgi:pantetheine-phosphate adenylyltransferase
MRVCIGGTFNRLHKGHKKLIEKAIKLAGHDGFLFIGICNQSLLENKPYVEIFEKRRNNLLLFLHSFKKKEQLPTVVLEPIEKVEGPTLSRDFDAIVVSPETKKNAEIINKKREQRDLKPMQIFTIPLVLAEDKKKISSTRIIKNEIDDEGNLL